MAIPIGNPSGRRHVAILLLLGAAGASACFAVLAEAVRLQRTQAFDEWALRSLRSSEDPWVPIGPAWIAPAATAVTFWGSLVGIVLVSVAAAAFFGRRGEGVPRGEGVSRGEGVPPLRPEGILPSVSSSVASSSPPSSSSSSSAAAALKTAEKEEEKETRGRDAHGTRGRDAHATKRLLAAGLLGSLILSETLKRIFDRPRPDVVPHLEQVPPHSFPSGHAMLAAAMYFTIAFLLVRGTGSRVRRAGFLLAAVLVVALVGASRVVLGVHYPTDVLAGWAGGLAWALVCQAAARYLSRSSAAPE
jgi:hypothetical protein